MNTLNTSIKLVNDSVKFECSAQGREPFYVDYTPPLGNDEGYTSLELVQISVSTCYATAIAANLRRNARIINGLKVSACGVRQTVHPTKITNIEILKNILTPMQHNRDAKNLIQNYMRKSKTLKILHF